MDIRGRTCLAAITACTLFLLFSAESHSVSNTEAGRKYAVAQQRFADLKRSPKQRKYRSYWMDAARLFESIEKRYASSPVAADACFDRAGVYADLYAFTKLGRDIDEAARSFGKCQASHPRHVRAPEALYRIIVIEKDQKKDAAGAMETYRRLAEAYPNSDWTGRGRAKLGIAAPAAVARAGKNGRKVKKNGQELRKPPEPVIVAPKEMGTVRSVRYWSGGAYTRIVIDQDRQLKFQAHELKDPDRLVFDILGSRVSDSINKEPITVNDGILRQVRTSQFDAQTVRVVLDLASLKSYAAFPLKDPERLVIDVTGVAADDEPVEGTEAPAQTVQPAPPAQPQLKTDPDLRDDAKLSLSRQMSLKIKTIAIDAGHGGHDPGAIGRSGLKEKVITLDIARRLAALVKERLDAKVIMTRDRDEFIELEQRPFIAKSKGADLFVSIHVNANRKRRAKGIETYIQSLKASDREAMATAALENATSTKTLSQIGSELDRIVKDLRTDDKLNESLELAHAVQGSLVRTMKPVSGHVVNLGVKRAFFYVLINTEMPSILAEVGFISNPDEERLLKKETYRQKIAEALFEGVKKYVESRNPQTAGI